MFNNTQACAREMTLREKAEDAYHRIEVLEKEVEELRNQFSRVRLEVEGPRDIPSR